MPPLQAPVRVDKPARATTEARSDAPSTPETMTGHGPTPPDPRWPGGAKIAVQIVLNYEEGGENNILPTTRRRRRSCPRITGAAPLARGSGTGTWNRLYEYGARGRGFWRLHRMLSATCPDHGLRRPPMGHGAGPRPRTGSPRMPDAGWEIAGHGLKWWNIATCPRRRKRAQILEAIRCTQEDDRRPPARLVQPGAVR